jgi:histidinol-phosphate aminotransferase
MSARAAVAAMTAYTLELREAEIKLNQNESPYDVPRELKEKALRGLLDRGWNIYPDFEAIHLRGAVADAYGLASENVLVGNGSNELLAATIGAFVGPGTPVVIPRPTFTLYEKLVTIAGGLVVPVDVDPATGILPESAIAAAAASLRGAVVIVCSPNNPTGGILPAGGIERLLSSGATVLLDRAYGDFADDGIGADGRPPILDDRLITFSTFSKAWGLAALRIGWLASTEGTCHQIRKVKLPYSLNIISEAVAVAALQDTRTRDTNVRHIVLERQRLFTAMQKLDGITPFPTHANFISFRAERTRSREVFETLHSRGILIRDVSSYQGLEHCLRVSIGTPAQNDRFLATLQEIA